MAYSIKDAAALLGLHPKTLRRWEDQKKFVPKRTLGNQRRFSDKDIAALRAIKEGTAEPVIYDRILSLEQAARKLNVSPDTVRRWTKQGKLALSVNDDLEQGYSEKALDKLIKPQAKTATLPPPPKTPILPPVATGFPLPKKWQKPFIYATLATILATAGILAYLLILKPPFLANPSVEQLDLTQDIEVALPRVGVFLDGHITIGSDAGDYSFLDQNANLYVKNEALIEGGVNTNTLQLLPSEQPENQIGKLYVNQDSGNLMYFDGLGWITLAGGSSGKPTLQDVYDSGNTTLIADDQDIDITLGNNATASATSFKLTLAGTTSAFQILGGASQEIATFDDDSLYPVTISQQMQVLANLYARQFVDSDNVNYFLDPANSAVSLAVAGNATIASTLTFRTNGEYLTNSVDNYLISSGGLGVGGSTSYGISSDGHGNFKKGNFEETITANALLDANGQVDLGDGGDAITFDGSSITLPDFTSCTLTTNGSGVLTCGASSSDADTLDGLDSTQFLRSDASDSFTSGTLTLDTGTTLAVNGTLDANGAVTLGDGGDAITVDGSSLTLQTTGAGSDITLNAVDQIILTDFTTCTALETDGSGLLTCGTDDTSGGDATTLDSLDSTQFLRSDTSDSFTSGTLTLDAGTTLDINGDLSVADTNISLDGATTTLTQTTGGLFLDAGGTQPITIKDNLEVDGAATVSGTLTFNGVTYTFPAADAAGSGYSLTSNGAGVLSWTDVTGGGGINADTLDSLDSTQFLRSDTSDSFTSGTLTFDAGTTLSVSGTLALPGAAAGTDNTVLVLNGSNQVVTDEIDSRVWGTSLIDGTGGAGYLSYFTDGDTLANSMIYQSLGKVNVNTTSGLGLFNVEGDGGGNALAIFNETTGAQDIITASASSVTRFRVDTNGYVIAQRFSDLADTSYFIDPAASGTSLNIDGNIVSNGAFSISSNGDNNITIDAGTGTVIIGSGSGKLDAGTVDPPYTINGEKYATYLSGMTGVKEETTGVITTGDYEPGVGYKHTIDFANLQKDSDLWLFTKTADLKNNLGKLVVLLSPAGAARTWYTLDTINNKLNIYSTLPTSISYRLTAPRFDADSWANTRNTESVGFILNDEEEWQQNLAGTIIGNSNSPMFEMWDEFVSYLSKINLNLKSITVQEKIISPLVETQNLATNFISPLTETEPITIDADVSVSGTLQANEVVSGQGSFGSLKADSVESATIDNLRDKIADLAEYYREQTATAAAAPSDPTAEDIALELLTPSASDSAYMTVENLEAKAGFFSEYLAVIGQATLTDVKINNLLTVDSITSGNGAINFLAGLMTLDATGKVYINGDLTVSGLASINQLQTNTASVSGTLIASQINPQPETDLSIQIASQSALSIYNLIDNQAVASIDASGAGSFSRLNLKASGTATISAGLNSIAVNTDELTPASQVIVTFTSNYAPATKYWVTKEPQQKLFNVFVNYPVNEETTLDWLLIN